MKVARRYIALFLSLVFSLVFSSYAFGVELSVTDAEGDIRVVNTISVDIIVDDPTDITGVAFTLSYDTQAMTLVSVASDFFSSFANQFSTLPGYGEPFVDPSDGVTYLPFTIGLETINIPVAETIDGNVFNQPVLVGPQSATGNSIVAARLGSGGGNTNTLFTLTFNISNASEEVYPITLEQTRISNTNAGYSASGEAVPMLISAAPPAQGQDLTDPAVFPEISVHAVHTGFVTIRGNRPLGIINKPAQAVTIEAGDSSVEYRVSGGDSSLYTWTVTNSSNDLVDTQAGSSFTFNAPATGNFAGVYTVSVTDNQGVSDTFAIKVPFEISPATLSFTEVMLNGNANPQHFTVTGAEGDFTWEILAAEGADDAAEDSDEYGTWETASPVYADNTNILHPADVAEWLSFYIRVTVDNDAGLTSSNGLHQRVVGPFILVPVATYSVSLSDENGPLSGEDFAIGDITVTEVSTSQTKNQISFDGIVSFLLPDVGGTYHYEISDNREPFTYLTQSISSEEKSVNITLATERVDRLEGVVEDISTLPVAGATVTAYQPDNVTVLYQANTNADGSYSISLPAGAPQSGWSVVASHADFISQRHDDQAVGTIDFTGNKALYAETRIINVAAISDGSVVRIDITAHPAIMNISEVDVTIDAGSGNLSVPSLIGNTVSIYYDVIENFEATVSVDTSEDFNPNTGYAATQLLTFESKLTAATLVPLGSNGGTAVMQANNQTVVVNVPAGGINGDIYIAIEQYASTSRDAKRHPYVYDITAYDNLTDTEITESNLNYLEITLPIDLSLISPGDLENEQWVIRHAKDIIALEAGNSKMERSSSIISTDYIGDGQTGSVTFHVSSLSIFEIASSAESLNSLASAAGGGGCFIATSANDASLHIYEVVMKKIQNVLQWVAN